MPLAIIRFLLACSIGFALELGLDYFFRPNDLLNPITRLAGVYHWLVTSGPRKPELNITNLVELNKETTRDDVSSSNVCRERAFTGAMLATLSQAHPSVVVLDKWYEPQSCEHDLHDRELSQMLIAGIRKLCADRTTVVVGRQVNLEQSSLPLNPAINFKAEGCGCVKEGIANVDSDLRRIPLWWLGVDSVAEWNGPPPSMALVAGIAKNPTLLQNPMLARAKWMLAQAKSEPLYVSFLSSAQFEGVILPVKNLVCGDEPWRACREGERPPDAICGQPGSWTECKNDKTPQLVDSIRNGQVVVFGEQTQGVDEWPTVVGKQYGFILQANYIESLLDHRLFRKVPDWIDIVAGLVMLLGFEFILKFYEAKRLLALALAGLFIVVVFLIVYLVVNLAGFYPDPRFGIFSILGSRVVEFFVRHPPAGG
jgi:hypothetical protein